MKIYKVGIELEGKWDKNPPDCDIYEDGSVGFDSDSDDIEHNCYCDDLNEDEGECSCCRGECECYDNQDNRYIGEISSKPLELYEAIRFLDSNYPMDINRSCGYHIHISLKSRLHYSQLMTKKFYAYFLDECKKFGEENKINSDSAFWDRLNGNNTMCKKEFHADKQAQQFSKNGNRYCQLNYCYNLHNTLEFRLFPMFKKKDLAHKALLFIVNTIEVFLAKQKTEKPIICKIIPQDQQEEFEVICV